MSQTGLLERLPHRAPMALVEHIDDLDVAAGTLRARTAPFSAHQLLADSFRRPARCWPPVLMLEAWCQAAGLLLIAGQRTAPGQLAVLISRLAEVHQLRAPHEEEPLILTVTRTAHFEAADQFCGLVRTAAGAAITTVGQLTATVRPIEDLKERR